jgi:hypothetical protein
LPIVLQILASEELELGARQAGKDMDSSRKEKEKRKKGEY